MTSLSRSSGRREFLLAAGIWPWTWFRRDPSLAGIRFRQVRRTGGRRYIHIHGDERTAFEVLESLTSRARGDVFFIQSNTRDVQVRGLTIDPNRMWSRAGAERSLRNLNKTDTGVDQALRAIEDDREGVLRRLLPRGGELLVALHNNGPGYSVEDETAISDQVARNDKEHPDEFILCSVRADFDIQSRGPFNVVLQQNPKGEDDGSLSRLWAARNVRYVNIEAARGNAAAQRNMLDWVERVL